MQEIKGNLIELALGGEFDAIVHGCNCFNIMGSGVALAIRRAFPQAYEVDLRTKSGDRSKLGTCSFARGNARNGFVFSIYNAYTQYRYGVKDGPHFDMAAFRRCLQYIDNHAGEGVRIGMPRIGAGLGGGNWNEIAPVIEEVLCHRDVVIVVL